ncbi:subtilisin-like protein [Massarina eburnea CBS 473.64]|uniref:Subtilisin-like protein n=1 Tax=Massarina eburnea CBS 473.64 TaxID=1395130 RepID=A0A6A6RPR9_9PLEO|nr:subtilisin-like protein [Massarina eburnea CBS 473.64]
MPESDLKAKRQQYDDWKWMFIRTAELFEKTKVAQSDRVRIAVLDTGLDKSHPHIKMEIERVWVYDKSKRTFTKGASTNIVDTKGHGTHIVGLVLEYAHEADVFVADVDFDNEPNRDMIADAIVAAVKNKIDIISISVGFQQRVLGDAMERAIDYAKANNVLIFAAASNSGANAGRSWPARYDGVFAIHSTDTNGNPSGFNPTEFEGINFATVGEAVESSWPNHLSRSPAKLPNGKGLKGQDTKGGVDFSPDCSVEVKSGTSFATPIAASLAVFLLQYAKKNLEPKFVAQLKRYGTMQSVLKCLAGTKRGGFYYLTLRIHPDHLFGKENAEEIKRIIEAAINESG